MLDIQIFQLRFHNSTPICDFLTVINSGWGLLTEVEWYGNDTYMIRMSDIFEWYQDDPVNFLEVYCLYLGKDVSLDEAVNDFNYNYSGNFKGWLINKIRSEYDEFFENISDYCAGRLSLKELVKRSESIDEEAGSYIHELDYLE